MVRTVGLCSIWSRIQSLRTNDQEQLIDLPETAQLWGHRNRNNSRLQLQCPRLSSTQSMSQVMWSSPSVSISLLWSTKITVPLDSWRLIKCHALIHLFALILFTHISNSRAMKKNPNRVEGDEIFTVMSHESIVCYILKHNILKHLPVFWEMNLVISIFYTRNALRPHYIEQES